MIEDEICLWYHIARHCLKFFWASGKSVLFIFLFLSKYHPGWILCDLCRIYRISDLHIIFCYTFKRLANKIFVKIKNKNKFIWRKNKIFTTLKMFCKSTFVSNNLINFSIGWNICAISSNIEQMYELCTTLYWSHKCIIWLKRLLSYCCKNLSHYKAFFEL